ncbi:MAG: amidase family protein [Vicinamibacterales bacterium]
MSEIRATYASAWRTRPDAFSTEFSAVFTAPRIDDRTLARALAAREAFERRIRTLFTLVDVLAMPTVPLVAPPIDGPIDGMRILRNTWAWNAARVPAVSVPCGTGADGLPVGLQLVGAADDEATLLAAATLVERATSR